jgi:2-polyprenyl-3-methyl-5-hydroxy-6-metoxy-1,4-benzoquinol methylase
MDELAVQERRKYEKIWSSFPEYRLYSPADYITPIFLLYFQKRIEKGDSVIDFGCGPGRSAVALLEAGLKIHLVDICENCLDPEIFSSYLKSAFQFTRATLWDLPGDLPPSEWGICFDVLEHIPEEKVDAVLRGMSLRMKKGGLLAIHLTKDQFGEQVGESLHLTIRSADWWKEKVGRYFSICQECSFVTVILLAVERL